MIPVRYLLPFFVAFNVFRYVRLYPSLYACFLLCLHSYAIFFIFPSVHSCSLISVRSSLSFIVCVLSSLSPFLCDLLYLSFCSFLLVLISVRSYSILISVQSPLSFSVAAFNSHFSCLWLCLSSFVTRFWSNRL